MAYVCNYIGKIDQQNFVVTIVNGNNGELLNRYQHLRNAKATTSKINEDKARGKKQRLKKTHSRAISQNKMVRGMLGYAKVYTILESFQVCTLPLGLQAGVDIEKNNNVIELFVNDAADISITINNKSR